MATLVCFHAHPDDEAIATAGTLAKAKATGHRTVVVFATRGELGQQPAWMNEDVSLADLRMSEAHAACELLGVDRVAWLPYRDSGVEDDDRNADPDTFHSAPVEHAAADLAAILREEAADVLTHYDENGNYGHPDHIKVHHVGYLAAELAGTALVYEATMDRDVIVRNIRAAMAEEMPAEDLPDPETMKLGMPSSTITTEVDVTEYVHLKRAAMAAHRSQIDDNSFFLKMDETRFAQAFGTEWFIRRGGPLAPQERETDLFAALDALLT